MSGVDRHEFRIRVRSDDAIMRDHRVHGVRIMPGVTFLDIACRAADRTVPGNHGVDIRRLIFPRPFCLSADSERWIRIQLIAAGGHWLLNASSTASDGISDEQEHARGELHSRPADATFPPNLDIAGLQQRAEATSHWTDLYAALENLGIRHGPFMRPSGRVFRGADYVLAEMALSSEAEPYAGRFRFAPPFLDAATGIAFFSDTAAARYSGRPCVPLYLDRFTTGNRGPSGNRIWAYLPMDATRESTATADFSSDPRIDLYSGAGEWIARLEGLSFKQVRSASSIVDLVEPHRQTANGSKSNALHVTEAADSECSEPSDANGISRSHSDSDTDSSVLEILKTLTAETGELDSETLDERTGFYDLGLDSAQLLTIAARLEGIIGESLYPTLLFEYPTLAQLAGYLTTHHGKAFHRIPPPNGANSTGSTEPTESGAVVDASTDAGNAPATDAHQPTPQELHFYDWSWALTENCADHGKCANPDDSAIVLVFGNDPPLAAELRKPGSKRRVYNIRDGDAFQALTGDEFAMRPESASDMNTLLEHLTKLGCSRVHAVAARKLDGPASAAETARDAGARSRLVTESVRSMLGLVQSVLAARSTLPITMIWPHSSSVTGRLTGGAVAGFAASLQREHPGFSLRAVETGDAGDAKRLARHLADEWSRTRPPEIRLIRGRRWARTITETHRSSPSTEPLIRRRGVYWITGGAGGVGRFIARRLIQEFEATVIVTGRAAAAADLDGAHYMQADVTDAAAMTRVLAETRRRFGRLDGVLHAAAVLKDGLTLRMSTSDLTDVLAPKITGAFVLDEVTRDEPLQLFMLFGSLSSVVGNPGQSAYTAANRFLAGFADWRQAMADAGERRGATVCCHWPLWRDGGMNVTEKVEARLFNETGMSPLDENAAWNLFIEAARARSPQFIGVAGHKAKLNAHLNSGPLGNAASIDPADIPPSDHVSSGSAPAKQSANSDGTEPIAIIGLSGRYPGADDLDEFWDNLAAGRDSISEIPAERWDHRRFTAGNGHSAGPPRWGGFLRNVDRFDALFFRIAPREAIRMDPQERLFLEVAWNAVEDSGYTPGTLGPEPGDSNSSEVGVFVGVMWGDYQKFGAEELARGRVSNPGSPFWSIANRVSYCMNFSGPSLAVDSACSSSLTAIHLACESLRRGECQTAVAGGVNLSLHPGKYLLLTELEMLSSDGRCRSFGEGGDGYVPGEGVGALVLKPLRAAIEDGDTIHAVIRGSGINHDGRGGGYTVPNPRAQSALIGRVLDRAGIPPSAISYIEAHGTGTALGDPVEIRGLTRAFDPDANATSDAGAGRSCAIGSLKSNIGHLESAAGIAAISKVVLQLNHRQLVPSLHSQPLNAKIDFDATPFRVQTRLEPWQPVRSPTPAISDAAPLRAGVSSFGAGGANAHIVLEEAPAVARPDTCQPAPVLLLSAATRDRLMELARRWRRFLENDRGSAHFSDALFTAQVGREPATERLAIVATDRARVIAGLDAYLTGRPSPDYIEGATRGNGSKRRTTQSDTDTDTDSDGKTKPFMRDAAGWVKGAEVNWRRLVRGVPRRVSCPTYPFAGKRYWITTSGPAASSETPSNGESTPNTRPSPAPAGVGPDGDGTNGHPAGILCFKPVWHSSPAPGDRSTDVEQLLVFDNSEAFTRELAGEWNGPVARIHSGSRWSQPDAGTWEIDPLREDHFERLWKRFAPDDRRLTILIQGPGWPRSSPGSEDDSKSAMWLDPWYHFGRSLGTAGIAARLVVARPASVAVEAMGGAVDGFLNALRREHPRIVPQTIRLDLVNPRVAATVLTAELLSAARTRHVRFRGAFRDALSWESFDPNSERIASDHRIHLRQGGTYVITGGTGGVGGLFAAHLAQNYAANLVIVGRTPLPSEFDWETAAEDVTTTPAVRQRLARLIELKRSGGQIVYAECDVADADGMRRVVDVARDRFRNLNGVLHCAGITEDRSLTAKPIDSWHRVLAPKITGARVLDHLTRSDDLDFFFLFSSIAPVIGNLGQCDYAAANGFLDGFTRFREHQRARGRRRGRTICLNWPLWNDGGMTAGDPTSALAFRRAGLVPLASADGIQLFEQSLNTLPSRWLLLAGESQRLEKWLPEMAGGAGFSAGISPPTSSPTRRPTDADTDSAARRLIRVSEYLAHLLADVLKLDPDDVDPDTAFEEFGIDSIATRELVQRVNADWNDILDPFIVAERNTLHSLAAHLAALDVDVDVDADSATRMDPGAIAVPINGNADGIGNSNGGGRCSPNGGDREVSSPSKPTPDAADRDTPEPAPGQAPFVSGGAAPQGDIAVVGMACRFPGAPDLESFWNDLRDGQCRIGEIPADRRRMMDRFVFRPGEPGPGASYSKWGGFIEGATLFDPEYFGLTEREALVMDPVHRLFLETSARALENAGWALREARGSRGGIFVGARQGAYAALAGARKLWETDPAGAWHYNAACMIASRAAQVFDWTGPVAVVDTACSSSLVAVHLACESLRRGECDRAIAGGADLLLSADDFVHFSQSRSLSPDGQCRPFEGGATGTVLGEGCGAVVLKRLDQARADGDCIWAIIRGSAMNNDGAGRGGSAKVEAFKQVMRSATARAAVEFGALGYIELHGEGSLLRDAAELRAIRELWREDGSRRGGICPIGSVKANIGHLLLASGIAGFIKTCLAVNHGVYPRHPHPAEPARFADLTKTPYRFVMEAIPWGDPKEPDKRTRIAGVHSTGIADTNCFVICEADAASGSRAERAVEVRPVNRRRFWLGPDDRRETAGDDIGDARSVLEALSAGTLDIGEARARIATTGDNKPVQPEPGITQTDPRRAVLDRLSKGELSIGDAQQGLAAIMTSGSGKRSACGPENSERNRME